MVPHHLAIIMDGNRRWAKQRRLEILRGHSQGSSVLKEISKSAHKKGISYLTVFAFSTENWKRPQAEVKGLIELMRRFLMQDMESLITDNVKLRIIGDISVFDQDLQALFQDAMARTAANDGLNLSIAVNYGGKQDLMQAFASLAGDETSLAEGTEAAVKARLQTKDLPNIDLLVRTGGEYRISNFILWESAYAELYFTDCYWPDFSEAELDKALEAFDGRQRRFGGDDMPQQSSKKA